MLDLQEAKRFISGVDSKTRELELEKVKLEQQQEYAQKALSDNEAKIKELGCTPETLPTEMESMSASAQKIRTKIEAILDGSSNE